MNAPEINERSAMQKIKEKAVALIEQAKLVPKTGSMAQALVLTGLHEIRDLAEYELERFRRNGK